MAASATNSCMAFVYHGCGYSRLHTMTQPLIGTQLGRSLCVVTIIALGACGTRALPDTPSAAQGPAPADAGAPPRGEPVLRKVASVALQLEGGRIWLAITNEVGATDLVDVASYDGVCTDQVDTQGDPEAVQAAVFAVDCDLGGGQGVRLRFVHRAHQLIVLRAPAGTSDFEMWRALELPRESRVSFD